MKKIATLLIVLSLLIPSIASASIAYDSTTKQNWNDGSSETFSHTCSGDDRFLVVFLWISGSSITVSSVTYDGDAMTELATQVHKSSSNNVSHMYYLANPSTGTNNIVLTLSTSAYKDIAVVSYTGVDGTESYVTDTGDATVASYDVDLVTSSDGWILFGARYTNILTFNSGSERTTRSGTGSMIGDSNSLLSAGTNTFNWTKTSTYRLDGIIMMDMLPVAEATPVDADISILGDMTIK